MTAKRAVSCRQTTPGATVLLRIGETIDRYRIEALIGQGGMAAVYRARHIRLDSEHALKVLFVTAPKLCDRLIREGRVQANLRHSNIVEASWHALVDALTYAVRHRGPARA